MFGDMANAFLFCSERLSGDPAGNANSLIRIRPTSAATTADENDSVSVQQIQKIARAARDPVDKHNKPSGHVLPIYQRSHIEARLLGYGGDEDDWRRLVRTIRD
jgi:hypothetical protein